MEDSNWWMNKNALGDIALTTYQSDKIKVNEMDVTQDTWRLERNLQILIGTPEGQRVLWKYWCSWDDSFMVVIGEIVCEGMK